MNTLVIDDVPDFAKVISDIIKDRLKTDREFAEIMLKIILENHKDL